MSSVRVLKAAPESLVTAAINEALTIDWSAVSDPRSSRSIFSSSTAIHLRVHAIHPQTPDTPAARAAIVECSNTAERVKFVNIGNLIDWAYSEVCGTRLGRIMIVNLAPAGVVKNHIDRGKYFDEHFRFHIPLITTKDVMFTGPDDSLAHMPKGRLCQLLNRNLHGVTNKSSLDRIHLIFDAQSFDDRFRYEATND